MAEPSQKQLRPGESRYEVRERKTGRNTTYFVYDRARGCQPSILPGFGRVPESSDRKEVEEGMARLAAFMGVSG